MSRTVDSMRALAAVPALGAVAPAWAGGGAELARVGPHGVQGNGFSSGSAISAESRFVAFASGASNLVPGDTNRARHVSVRTLAP